MQKSLLRTFGSASCDGWDIAEIGTRARARKGNLKGVLSVQSDTRVFNNPHMWAWKTTLNQVKSYIVNQF